MSDDFVPRNKVERLLQRITDPIIPEHGPVYLFAQWSGDSLRCVSDIFRRAKARRRRGKRTKSGRRERFRHFVGVLAPAEADVRRAKTGRRDE